MGKIILNLEQLHELVSVNRYKVNPVKKFLARCIDGRYSDGENLPPLAFSGGDAGDLALIFATANSYGFEVDNERTFKTLVELIGGEKNLGFHTDNHADKKLVLGGCGHIKQMDLDPDAYKIEKDQLNFIKEKFSEVQKKEDNQVILNGDHMEGAVVLINGNWGVYPKYQSVNLNKNLIWEVFIFHQSLVDDRHRALAKKLLENQAVKLFKGLDEDYLYQAFSDVSVDHLMETAKRLAKGLPIFEVKFEDNGSFKIESLETV